MVRCGLENQSDCDAALRGKRLGLITSVSGVDSSLRSTIELLHERYGLSALFGPEHGVRGDRDAGQTVENYIDPQTGLMVHSLYRKDSKHMTPEMLQSLDAVVYDIQDLGTRFYTFISTLLYAVEDCAASHKELIVLDRPAPLDGCTVEGGMLQPAYSSFVGAYALPVRYGLTAGELARMYNEREGLGCNLTVVPVQGWKRKMRYPDTGRLFMTPSLGIPRFETALVYPGMCFFEGTNLSEGRGTSCPFEMVGAPWIDGHRLAKEMNSKKLPGVIFTAAFFTPTASKHQGKACQGVQLHVQNADSFLPVCTALELLDTVRKLYPKEFSFLPPVKQGGRPFISLLAGCDAFEDPDWDKDALIKRFEQESAAFELQKRQYHLYD